MSQQKTMAQKSMSGQFHELMEKPGIINSLGADANTGHGDLHNVMRCVHEF
ncbi:MAG: hypothetical protein IH836_07015 [Proteobacteria bacterium]|nr:hypothetical protein [Pseudomonadota bacterium]